VLTQRLESNSVHFDNTKQISGALYFTSFRQTHVTLKQSVYKTRSLKKDNKFGSHLRGVFMSLNSFNWILINSTSQHHAKWLLVGGQVQHNSIPDIGSVSELPIRPRINATPNSSSPVFTQTPRSSTCPRQRQVWLYHYVSPQPQRPLGFHKAVFPRTEIEVMDGVTYPCLYNVERCLRRANVAINIHALD
jgi:hypothetical protein